MGRPSYSSKTEADYLLKVNIYWLKQKGVFKSRQWCRCEITWTNNSTGRQNNMSVEVSILGVNRHARFIYTQTNRETGEEKNFDYKVPIETTRCYFGGQRYWFRCPFSVRGNYCGRRVATLYKKDDYFACRHCNNLTYTSQKQNYKGELGFLTSFLRQDEKAAKLRSQIKRQTYAGKPTKKLLRLQKLTDYDPEVICSIINNGLYRTKRVNNS